MASTVRFSDETSRWAAVVARDASADGAFVYCVKTTMIFCRPTCKARLARRANVVFFDKPAEAQDAGFRSCKRCQPLLEGLYTPEADKIKKVCNLLDTLPDNSPLPGLQSLAKEAGLTKHHFHRLFKRETGVTPRQYALASRGSNNSESADSAAMTPITPVTPHSNQISTPIMVSDETFDMSGAIPGFDDEVSKDVPVEDLGSFVIYYGLVDTTFGLLLVAFENGQVSKIELGSNEHDLLSTLESLYPSLYHLHSPIDFASNEEVQNFRLQIDAVVEALENPSGQVLDMPTSLNLTNDDAFS